MHEPKSYLASLQSDLSGSLSHFRQSCSGQEEEYYSGGVLTASDPDLFGGLANDYGTAQTLGAAVVPS